MKLKVLLILMLAAVTFTSYAQDGGIRGKVVSRNGRVALSNVQVKIESLGLTATTDKDGNYSFTGLNDGTYTVRPNQKGKGKPAHGPNRTAAPAGRQPSPGARFAPHSAPGHKPKKNQQKENTSWKTGTKKK